MSVHVCARVVSVRAPNPICSMNIQLIYDCSEYPTAEHFLCHYDMHLACKKWQTCSVDQGRLIDCKYTDAYANVSGQTQLHYAAASGLTRWHMQNRPADIIAYAIMSSG